MPTRRASPAAAIRAEMVMSAPLVHLKMSDSMTHAAAVFLDRGISGAPVRDHWGRAVGVLTKTDLVRYERERVPVRSDNEALRTRGTLELIAKGSGFHREAEEDCVAAWMTPKVIAVETGASLIEVLREMSGRRLHRIFVRDGKSSRLLGVITAFDLMKVLARALMAGPRSPTKAAS